MADDRTAGRRAHRGRVVMLVDNGVDGDSRVQKTARSAAAAGWEVILLGRSPDRTARTWFIGEAEARHLPMRSPLLKQRYEFRRASLREPLAYPPGPMAGHRQQQVKMWRAELAQRAAALRAADRPGRRALLLVPRGASKALNHWVRLRVRRSNALRRKRSALTAPLDRATTRFWGTLLGDRVWRRFDPHLWDYELAYGRAIDELRPDLIHANDFRMLGVGARAALRARAGGRPVKLVWDAHEFLPGIKPWNDNPRWHLAQCAHEREYARYADAVVTVSETLADLLAEHHGLPERPAVVLNAPARAETVADPGAPDLRALCGLGPDVPLVVYSGAAAPQRGLDIMIRALPWLPGVHVALVVLRPAGAYVAGLLERAAELGVAGRVHALPYVRYDQVVPFLSAADAGVIPIHHWPNHEIALITKFFEYSHARLPLVVSDVKTMSETVRSTGQGEVFTAEDVDDYVRAVRAVLAAPARYRAAYDIPGLLAEWTWEAQAAILDGVYAGLLDRPRALRAAAGEPHPPEPEAAEAAI